jgi:hypothetical protein
VSRDFLLLVFFIIQFPPSPKVFHLDRFEFFRKFAEIFASQGAPPVSTTQVANFSPIFASVVDTGGKFTNGVNDAGSKLPPVSTTPAANLPPMATISACRHLKVNLNGIIRGLGETGSRKKPEAKNLLTLSL